MRRTILLKTLMLVCFLSLCIARQAPAQPRNHDEDGAAPPQSSGGTVYYCASSWDHNVVYFSAPFETDELARTTIQEAYAQFLKQKYSYASGASSVVCSISQTLVSAQSDKSDDEDSVKRANHAATETGWTYGGASSGPPVAPSSASSRATSPAAGHAVTSSAHTPAPALHAEVPVNAAQAPAAHTVPAAAPAADQAQSPGASASGPGYYTLCRYQGQKDGHPIMYVTPIIHTNSAAGTISQDFYTYMTTTYDLSKVQYGSGYCRQVSSSTDQQAFTMSTLEKQWAASKTEVTHVDWSDTPAEIAAASARVAPPAASASVASPSSSSSSSPGQSAMPFISCSTSGGAGIDTYLTGVFPDVAPGETSAERRAC